MLAWITDNLGTLVVGAIVLAVVVAIAVSLINKKRKGQSSCSCGCSGCPMNGKCH